MAVHGLWEQRLERDQQRIVILDDDPTGTQTVSNVEVILHPSLEAYRRFFAGSEQAVYVLTNSRALPEAEAIALISRIRDEVALAAYEAGVPVTCILRGDSTLRGHVFAEMDALAAPFEDWVGLFIPAFPEGGRVTHNGIHYLIVNDERIPVAQTEFARDTTFGYQSERLVDWVAEVGNGRSARSLPLEEVRTQGSELVCRALIEAPTGSIIIPDAEQRTDLEIVIRGLLDAEQCGRHIIVRCASTFAAMRAKLHARQLQNIDPIDGPILLVCGSHTQASSRQLAKLVECGVSPVVIPTDWLLREGQEAVIPRLAQQISLDLEEHKFAILATERLRLPEHGDLATGAKIMSALTATVARVAGECKALIVKGGISSAQVATDGLSSTHAWVRGQLAAGISLWDLTLVDGRQLPYAVIPGNVGNDTTLVEIARLFGAAPLRALEGQRLLAAFQPVEQRSLVAELTQRLLDYLLSGDLKPGSRLPSERQLSETLGMGRSTLRESLKALTLLGLLDVRQGDGTYLRKADSVLLPRVIEWGLLLGEKRTMDLVEARYEIEIIIAELAAQRRDSFAVEDLRKMLQRMETAGLHYHEFVDADVAFHLKLAEIARNSVLRDILSSIQALLRAWIIRVLESAGNTTFSYKEHLAIFDAIERGDAKGAGDAMRAHMNSARNRLLKAISYQ